MSIKWRSVLIHPLVLGFILSTIAIVIFLKVLPHYKLAISEKTVISNNGSVYFHDLNSDGFSEKINYYENEDQNVPTLYLYDSQGSFISLLAFNDKPIKNLSLKFADYNYNKSSEIYALNQTNDSLFLNVIDFAAPKEFLVKRQFISQLPKDVTLLPLELTDFNDDKNKDVVIIFRKDTNLCSSQVILFDITNKTLIQSASFDLCITDYFIADANNDQKPEIYLSNKSTGNNAESVKSGLVVLDQSLNYVFSPVYFIGKESEVKLALLKEKENYQIAAIQSGKNNQKHFVNLVLFDFYGKKIKETSLDTNKTYSFIPVNDFKPSIRLFTGKSVDVFNENLENIAINSLGSNTYSFISREDLNNNHKCDFVLKSNSDLIIILDNFSEKAKLNIDNGQLMHFSINNNHDNKTQLSYIIENEWFLIDFYTHQSYLRNPLFHLLLYIIITLILFVVTKFFNNYQHKRRVSRFIESEAVQDKAINELEDKLGNKIEGLKKKIQNIKKGNDNEYEHVIEQIDDTYVQLKTISEKITRENTRGIQIHDFFNHLTETSTANKVKINLFPNDDWYEISTDLQNHLYKLFDDTLNHICDYVRNTNISISLTRHQNYINCLIEIEKDYIEILKQKSDKLNAIISRMLLLNVKYETDGTKGKGTILNFTIPLNSSFTDKKTDKKIRVIIAEDHDVSLFGLITLFKSKEDIEVIGTAKNGLEVLKILEEKTTDIVITDISMPGMDGIELSEKLKNDYPDIKVIVFTMYMENWFIEQLTKNGARGFVSKNSRISELVEAVRQVNKENYFYCHQFKSKFGLSSSNGTESQINMLNSLTSTELQIVEYYANNLKRKDIAARLSVHQNTVDSYLANILLKLNAGDEEEVIRIAKKQKFVTDLD